MNFIALMKMKPSDLSGRKIDATVSSSNSFVNSGPKCRALKWELKYKIIEQGHRIKTAKLRIYKIKSKLLEQQPLPIAVYKVSLCQRHLLYQFIIKVFQNDLYDISYMIHRRNNIISCLLDKQKLVSKNHKIDENAIMAVTMCGVIDS